MSIDPSILFSLSSQANFENGFNNSPENFEMKVNWFQNSIHWFNWINTALLNDSEEYEIEEYPFFYNDWEERYNFANNSGYVF